jgi:hypothetical protein
MRPHVSAETLARYRQDDLSPSRSARISAHLSRCSRCSGLNEDLGGVTTLLASVHPPPVPDNLTARIQSAVATEAARKVALPAGSKLAAAAAGSGAAGPADGGGPRHELVPGGFRRRGWHPRLPDMTPKFALSAVAAAAAVVVLGVGMYEVVSSGPSPSSSSAAGPDAAKPASEGSAPTRGPALQYQRNTLQASITPVSTGMNFTPGRLSAQAASAVAKYGSGGTTAGPMSSATHAPLAATGHPATFARLAVAALQGCVNRIAAGDLVELVEVARFQGSPATIIVTEATEGGPRQVWVVGTGCSASRSDVLRESALSTAG